MQTAIVSDKTTDKATDKRTIMRDKRAQGIAAMGLVTRQGDRFQVQTPSLRGRRASYEVWRDADGKVRCSCLEFDEHSESDSTFRCEHILAVKHSLAQRNAEAAIKPTEPKPTEPKPTNSVPAEAKQPATSQPQHIDSAASDAASATPPMQHLAPAAHEDESASEKPTAKTAEDDAHGFERELTNSVAATDTDAATPHDDAAQHDAHPAVRQFAPHITDKEFTMKRQQAIALEDEPTMTDDAAADAAVGITDASNTIVPLQFMNVLRTLRQPVDAKLVKTREGWTDRNGDKHLVEYVEWHTVADILDRTCPAWSHSVRNISQIGDIVAVTAAITIDGVTREGVGTGTADTETGIKKAEHDALKRAAIKFGLARDLYQRESDVIERTGGTPEAQGEFPRDPLAKSMSDLVTPKQLGMIRALAREAGIDHEAECQAQLRCRTEELSKRAASSFIDHLKNAGAATTTANTGMRRAS